ncbi:MAG: Uma2 family endonuclease [Planctomycetales bacterium]|nr:Uma2 family endonuclease [Planctomycetales bacterium]
MSTATTTTFSGAPGDFPVMPSADLARLLEQVDYELVDGKLRTRPMGAKSSWIGGRIYGYLFTFLVEHPIGHIFNPDCGYTCFPKNTLRKPDASFVRLGRLEDEVIPNGWIQIPPDLAVEVLSPGDVADEMDEKVQQYLKAGVRLVWEVHPASRTVIVHRLNGTIAALNETDSLDGEDVIPGFNVPLAKIFE